MEKNTNEPNNVVDKTTRNIALITCFAVALSIGITAYEESKSAFAGIITFICVFVSLVLCLAWLMKNQDRYEYGDEMFAAPPSPPAAVPAAQDDEEGF